MLNVEEKVIDQVQTLYKDLPHIGKSRRASEEIPSPVGTVVGGNAEWIEDAQTGFLAEAPTATSLGWP